MLLSLTAATDLQSLKKNNKKKNLMSVPLGMDFERSNRLRQETAMTLLFTSHTSWHQVMALEVCVYTGESINYWLTVWRSSFSLWRWWPKTWPRCHQTWENREEIKKDPSLIISTQCCFPFYSIHTLHYSGFTVSSTKKVSLLIVANRDNLITRIK